MSNLSPEQIALLLSDSQTKPSKVEDGPVSVEVLEKRKHPLAKCEVCPLNKARCAPSLNVDSKVAFVSRSPGAYDGRSGKPFSNPRGSKPVLEYLFGHYKVKTDDVLLTNVVLCESDDPPKEAVAACKPRLDAELRDCELIIAGGTEATTALTRYRAVFSGRPFIHKRGKARVIVTNNPALVIRNSDAFPDMVEDFRRAFDPPPPPVFPEVEIIDEPDRANAAIERWLSTQFSSPIASDLEWRSTNDGIVCAGFAARPEKAVVFGLGAFGDKRFRENLKRFYEREDVHFVWHNGKADTKVLVKAGVDARVDEDTYLQSYALDERPGYHSLEYLLSTKFGWPDYEPSSVKEFKKSGEFSGKTPQEQARSARELYKYNGWDCAGTLQLFGLQSPRMETDRGGSVVTLYNRLLRAGQRIRTVELNGFHFDAEEACNINEKEAIPRLFELTEHIREVTKHPLLNPRSPDQLKAVIYSEWSLKHSLRDSGKKKLSTSTGKEVREEIEAGRFTCESKYREQMVRWASAQRQFSKIDKLKGTYLEGLAIRAARTSDGKIYCSFNIGGTVSGRASSHDPNFQNIAREGYEEIPGIRTLFLPSPGNVIISADFSQAELRTCAKLSGDKNLLGIYRDSSRSLHKERAAAFYGADYTKEEYVKSKNINFGVTYGQSADAFAQMYHMPKREAQAYIDSWWREFPVLKEWTNELKIKARKEGFIQSPFGHKRRFHLITDDNKGDVEREAVNFLPQNIAAWLTISALVELVDLGVRIVATVHDSIVADVPADEAYDVARIMKEVMERQVYEQLGWDDVPFLVDVSIGKNWGELDELDLTEKVAA